MPIRPRIAVPLCALALASATGCSHTVTHRCAVPEPVVEAAPAPGRIPLTIAVRHAPPAPGEQLARQKDPHHRWIVEAMPPTRALFDRLAASTFERTVPREGPGSSAPAADAELEVRLERLDFDWGRFGPYRAAVAYRATLRDVDGTEIAPLDVAGSVEIPLSRALALTHCRGIGNAVALAMQEAGARFLGELGSDPAIAAWLRARALPLPVLAVRSADSYAHAPWTPAPEPAGALGDPGAPPSGETPPDAGSRPAPRPVQPGSPMAPRAFRLRVAAGVSAPDEEPGRLEDAGRGFSLVVFAAEYRPRRALGIALETGRVLRAYSGRTLPPAGPFARPSGISVDSRALGLGLRAVLPGGPVEPWAGATAHVLRTELCASYSVLGLPGCAGGPQVDWGVGLDLAAGLDVFLGSRWFTGLELRRLFAHGRFELVDRVSIGGVSLALSFGMALP